MNMSFHELYIWLTALDFPSLSAIWMWLITVPWWLAVGTAMLIVFAIRITWSMTFYYLNLLFDWTFKTGEKFGEWLQIARRHLVAAFEFGRSIKKRLVR